MELAAVQALSPGREVVVTVAPSRAVGEKRGKRRPGRVVLVHPRFVTVDHGAYRESYNLGELVSGRVKIEPAGEG